MQVAVVAIAVGTKRGVGHKGEVEAVLWHSSFSAEEMG
jgi:hypothetical protein